MLLTASFKFDPLRKEGEFHFNPVIWCPNTPAYTHNLFSPYHGAVVDLIECKLPNSPATTPQIAAGQVRRVWEGCAVHALLVPGSAWSSPRFGLFSKRDEYKCHTFIHLILCAVYIPFLFSPFCYFKAKQIMLVFKWERVKMGRGRLRRAGGSRRLGIHPVKVFYNRLCQNESVDWNEQCACGAFCLLISVNICPEYLKCSHC